MHKITLRKKYHIPELVKAHQSQSQFESNYQGILIFIEQNNPFRGEEESLGNYLIDSERIYFYRLDINAILNE